MCMGGPAVGPACQGSKPRRNPTRGQLPVATAADKGTPNSGSRGATGTVTPAGARPPSQSGSTTSSHLSTLRGDNSFRQFPLSVGSPVSVPIVRAPAQRRSKGKTEQVQLVPSRLSVDELPVTSVRISGQPVLQSERARWLLEVKWRPDHSTFALVVLYVRGGKATDEDEVSLVFGKDFPARDLRSMEQHRLVQSVMPQVEVEYYQVYGMSSDKGATATPTSDPINSDPIPKRSKWQWSYSPYQAACYALNHPFKIEEYVSADGRKSGDQWMVFSTKASNMRRVTPQFIANASLDLRYAEQSIVEVKHVLDLLDNTAKSSSKTVKEPARELAAWLKAALAASAHVYVTAALHSVDNSGTKGDKKRRITMRATLTLKQQAAMVRLATQGTEAAAGGASLSSSAVASASSSSSSAPSPAPVSYSKRDVRLSWHLDCTDVEGGANSPCNKGTPIYRYDSKGERQGDLVMLSVLTQWINRRPSSINDLAHLDETLDRQEQAAAQWKQQWDQQLKLLNTMREVAEPAHWCIAKITSKSQEVTRDQEREWRMCQVEIGEQAAAMAAAYEQAAQGRVSTSVMSALAVSRSTRTVMVPSSASCDVGQRVLLLLNVPAGRVGEVTTAGRVMVATGHSGKGTKKKQVRELLGAGEGVPVGERVAALRPGMQFQHSRKIRILNKAEIKRIWSIRDAGQKIIERTSTQASGGSACDEWMLMGILCVHLCCSAAMSLTANRRVKLADLCLQAVNMCEAVTPHSQREPSVTDEREAELRLMGLSKAVGIQRETAPSLGT